MLTLKRLPSSGTEDFLADLAEAAYQVALRHGIKGSFLDLELDLWHEMRAVVRQHEESGRWPS